MSDQTIEALEAEYSALYSDLTETIDDRPLEKAERLRWAAIKREKRARELEIEKLLNEQGEAFARARDDAEREQRQKQIQLLEKERELIVCILAIYEDIRRTDGQYRRREEADRAGDGEIAAAAGLGREHEALEPLEALEDVENRGALYDAVEPPGSPDRIAAELIPLTDIIDQLRDSRVPGFDWQQPHTCGPLFALLADSLGKIDAEHKNLPDVFKSREHLALVHYNNLRLRHGMKLSKGVRQFERDLNYAKKAVRAAHTGRRLPRRGIQRKR